MQRNKLRMKKHQATYLRSIKQQANNDQQQAKQHKNHEERQRDYSIKNILKIKKILLFVKKKKIKVLLKSPMLMQRISSQHQQGIMQHKTQRKMQQEDATTCNTEWQRAITC